MKVTYCFHVLAVFIFGLFQVSEGQTWRGNVCSRRVPDYYRVWRCYKWDWGNCWRSRWFTVCRYRTIRFCCAGWRDRNGDRNCRDPICRGDCYGGGTCVRPNKCDCDRQFTGEVCREFTCSELRPCYPGECGETADTCTCSDHFGGNRCDTMENHININPELTTAWASLEEYERATDMIHYGFRTDVTDPDNANNLQTVWWNFDRYNVLMIHWEGENEIINDLPPIPTDYMRNAEFGIVEAKVDVVHRKVKFGSGSTGGEWIVAGTNTRNCSGLSERNPVGFLNCTIRIDYVYRLEHRDRLDITVGIKSGGYRQFIRRPLRLSSTFEYYKGQWKTKTMQYRFDFKVPTHCVETDTCRPGERPLYVEDGLDLRKDEFTMGWDDWDDAVSGVYRYVVELFKLKPDRDGQLTEPQEPIDIKEFNASDPHRATFKPNLPGMYSIMLEATDRANNSKYSRRLVLYDPTNSEVEINTASDSKLYIGKDSAESGFQWLSDLVNAINVTWKDHFANRVHEENKLLNVVLPYPKLRKVGKNVSYALDDHEGDRTLDAINNTHGIVRCQYYAKTDSNKGVTCIQSSIEESQWLEIEKSDVLEESFSFDLARNSGDSVCVWVRAYDVLGNRATDWAIAHFDNTKPILQSPRLFNSTTDAPIPGCRFCSRVNLITEDGESGVFSIRWRLMNNVTGMELGNGVVNNLWIENAKKRRRKKRSTCSDLTKCYCVDFGGSTGTACFKRSNTFGISHCTIQVPKDELESLIVRVELDVVNGAGDVTTYDNLPFGKVTHLDELAYSAPHNFSVMDKSHLSATLHWTNQQNCYNRTLIQLGYKPVGSTNMTNEYKVIDILNDATQYSLNGLEKSTNYTLQFISVYGNQRSDASYFYVVTNDNPPWTAGEIVGLIIGILLLIVIAILLVLMFVLWRRGKLRSTIQRRYTQARSVLRNNVRRDRQTMRKTYIAGLGQEDELYVYGNMAFDAKQNWEIEGGDLDLQEVITEGRFARIYKGVLTQRNSGPKTVAAKMVKVTNLKPEEILVMKAKINFMATHALQHENVIQFIGAINDDESRGPIMLLEYCEMGTLRDWLVRQKQEVKVTEDIVEKLWHFSLDIAKGMEYLAGQDIVHRKLAARNILLDFTMKPKIIGFGPIPDELEEGESTSDKSSKGERLPMKWMAPELLKARSTRKAMEQSDVWAYGVVVWEIFSLGDQPYTNIRSRDLANKLKQGVRLKRPEFMPDEHDAMTKRCWNQMPEDRPCFSVLVKEQSMAFDNGGRATSYYDSNELNDYYYSQKH